MSPRLRAQAHLAAEKARLEQLFAASPEAVVLSSNDGAVLRASEAGRRVRPVLSGSAKLREISGFGVTVSVGSIFWHPDTGTPIEETLATAGARMYDDKRSR